ncbi:MAG: DUF2330 domain-containing protein [Polyangiaceae bacterium]
MIGFSRRTGTGLFTGLLCLASLSVIPLVASDAHACGGCFLPANGESTVVTAHRMALSISQQRTVLWDQIQYQGAPEEFAWVLPVKPGTTIELASDAFFEALDAGTTVHTSSPLGITCEVATPGNDYEDYGNDYSYSGGCSMTGCGMSAAGADRPGMAGTTYQDVPVDPPTPPVSVVHEESIGPYEAVILSSNKPGALYDWLLDHGYGIDPSMEPIVDSYEAEEFDFVALRLIPGADVRQMKPVRVTSPGAAPVLPLRMVAAGTGANVAMTLFLIGEGRWMPQNFGSVEVSPSQISWDFDAQSSNYSELRAAALASGDGSSWLTTFSKPGALLSPVYNPVSMQNVQYQASNGAAYGTMAELYVNQGYINGETSDTACLQNLYNLGLSSGLVVDPCATVGGDDLGTGGVGGSTATGGAGGMTATGGTGGVGGSTATGGTGGVTATGGMGGVGGSTAMGGTGGLTATGGTGGVVATGGTGGMTATGGAGGVTSTDTCGHSVCSTGDSLEFGCGECATKVCQIYPSCCLSTWEDACVAMVQNACGLVCGADGLPCAGQVKPEETLAQNLACGPLDDIAVALVGMHPSSVWITRLEANLPHAALANDLLLQPDPGQYPVDNWVVAPAYTGDPCSGVGAVAPPAARPQEPKKRPPAGPGDLVAIGLTLSALAGAAARRLLRKKAASLA